MDSNLEAAIVAAAVEMVKASKPKGLATLDRNLKDFETAYKQIKEIVEKERSVGH